MLARIEITLVVNDRPKMIYAENSYPSADISLGELEAEGKNVMQSFSEKNPKIDKSLLYFRVKLDIGSW